MVITEFVVAGAAFRRWRRKRRAAAEAVGVAPAADDAAPAPAPTPPPDDPVARELKTLDVGLAFSTAGMLAAGAGAVIAPPIGLLAIPCVAVPGVPFVARAARDVWQKRRLTFVGMEAIGVGAALATGSLGLCAFGLTIFMGGRRVLLATRRQTEADLEDALGGWAPTVWVLRDGAEVEVPLDAVEAGDHIVLGAGQVVPCDGVVVEGSLAVDQRMLTGESVLSEKLVGDPLHGATLAVGGRAVVAVDRAGRDTVAARLAELIARTDSYEQSLQNESEAIANASVPVSLFMGAVGGLTRGLTGAAAGVWAMCIETLWLSTPMTALAMVRRAASNGVLVQDGRSLDLLADIDTVVFDKTGTLTLDSLRVRAIHPAAGRAAADLLQLAATAEGRQRHPIALAIVAAADEAGVAGPARVVEASRYETGFGLRVRVDGADVVLGSRRMLARAGIALPADLDGVVAAADALGNSVVAMAVDGAYAGCVELEPNLRPEAAAVIAALHRRGLRTVILTGDEPGPTRALAEGLGVQAWFARTLPEEKDARIAALQAGGARVCFVGDGVNDALAMRRARVSVSLAGASALAVDSAQIVLREGGLRRLPDLFEMGARFQKARDRILAAAAFPSVVGFGGVLFAGLGPAAMAGCYATGLTIGLSVAANERRWTPPDLEPVG